MASNGQWMAADFIFPVVFHISGFLCVPLPSHSSLSLFRALKAGMQRPLLVCPPHRDYKNSTMVAALGALQALYMVRKHST